MNYISFNKPDITNKLKWWLGISGFVLSVSCAVPFESAETHGLGNGHVIGGYSLLNDLSFRFNYGITDIKDAGLSIDYPAPNFPGVLFFCTAKQYLLPIHKRNKDFRFLVTGSYGLTPLGRENRSVYPQFRSE